MRVSVIGGSRVGVDEKPYEIAYTVGQILADRGHSVVCGGRSGVMEAVCKGVQEHDGEWNRDGGEGEGGGRDGESDENAQRHGQTIGILPGEDCQTANEYVDTAIATGMGNARNVLVVMNGDATIAIDGATGTLSEIGHALDFGRPIAGLGTHDIDGVEPVSTPEDAVTYIEAKV